MPPEAQLREGSDRRRHLPPKDKAGGRIIVSCWAPQGPRGTRDHRAALPITRSGGTRGGTSAPFCAPGSSDPGRGGDPGAHRRSPHGRPRGRSRQTAPHPLRGAGKTSPPIAQMGRLGERKVPVQSKSVKAPLKVESTVSCFLVC